MSGRRHVLVASLGATWEVLPEVLGWLAPLSVDLYAHHPRAAALQEMRSRYGLTPPDEVWVLSTAGERAQRSLEALQTWWRRWCQRFGAADVPSLRVWIAHGTDALADSQECRVWREMALRAVLAAHEHAQGGCVTLSLAGGRKTMSADLQDAAHAFGAHALLHVVADDEVLRQSGWERKDGSHWLEPLPASIAGAISPMVISSSFGEPAIRMSIDGRALNTQAYPLTDGGDTPCCWKPDGQWLSDQIEHRRREAQRLLVGQAVFMAAGEAYEPWPLLLRLDPQRVDALRAMPLRSNSNDPLANPHRWPLVDLHRHLGGCLSVQAQQHVAQVVLQSEARQLQQLVRRELSLRWPQWHQVPLDVPEDWPARLQAAARSLVEQYGWDLGRARALVSSVVLTEHPSDVISQMLWANTQPRVALKRTHRWGFSAYERPGELSGSALLGHPAAIAPYAQAVVEQSRSEGLLYLELRASPHKYRPQDPVAWVRELREQLARAGACVDPFDEGRTVRIGLIWIVDRRQIDTAGQVVNAAVDAYKVFPHFVLGLDLAGDEGTANPKSLARHFEPALKECMRITIHAGEGEAAESIWQAAYHLHADRIGHGLTLVDHPSLAQRFRDRGIALELCPTSNREVVGFRDPEIEPTWQMPEYPLRSMLKAGLPVTVNTDNPAISRTTIAEEYLVASRMSPDLTAWMGLAMLRLAYRHAFVGASERLKLERAAARRLLELATASDGQHS